MCSCLRLVFGALSVFFADRHLGFQCSCAFAKAIMPQRILMRLKHLLSGCYAKKAKRMRRNRGQYLWCIVFPKASLAAALSRTCSWRPDFGFGLFVGTRQLSRQFSVRHSRSRNFRPPRRAFMYIICSLQVVVGLASHLGSSTQTFQRQVASAPR